MPIRAGSAYFALTSQELPVRSAGLLRACPGFTGMATTSVSALYAATAYFSYEYALNYVQRPLSRPL